MGVRTWAAALAVGMALAGAAQAQSWKVERLVEGSHFHGVHGIRFAPSGELYAGSVAGQTLYAVDVKTGRVRTVQGPPHGMADDIAFGPGGQVVWTAISEGVVYSRTGDGPVTVLAKLASINSIAFSRDGKRLFAAQVFGGDDLWELDPAGARPPRKIRAAMGGFNSFWPGPDGKLYGPLWFKGQVVKVDPDTGAVEVVAQGLKTPASVKFDAKDRLFAIDTATGEVLRIDPKTGAKTVVATLSTSLDNFAPGPDGLLYVSNMADNGIQALDPDTGKVRQVVRGRLAFPADLAADASGRLYVADIFAFRAVDGRTGKVTDLERVHAQGARLEYPVGVALGRDRVLLASSPSGAVQAYDRATGAHLKTWHGLAAPTDVLELDGGDVLVTELATGRLTRLKGDLRTPVADGLAGPTSLAAGANGVAYVVESAAGRITRINLATGTKSVVTQALAQPKGLTVLPDGRLVTLEMAARRVTAVDPKTGAKTILAADLPLGLITQPVPLAGGVATDPAGVIYVASDVENAIYKLTPP